MIVTRLTCGDFALFWSFKTEIDRFERKRWYHQKGLRKWNATGCISNSFAPRMQRKLEILHEICQTVRRLIRDKIFSRSGPRAILVRVPMRPYAWRVDVNSAEHFQLRQRARRTRCVYIIFFFRKPNAHRPRRASFRAIRAYALVLLTTSRGESGREK